MGVIIFYSFFFVYCIFILIFTLNRKFISLKNNISFIKFVCIFFIYCMFILISFLNRKYYLIYLIFCKFFLFEIFFHLVHIHLNYLLYTGLNITRYDMNVNEHVYRGLEGILFPHINNYIGIHNYVLRNF